MLDDKHQPSPVFNTTHWTLVLEAAGNRPINSTQAFGQLYSDYWYPLYAYVRRRGYGPNEAEDIAQDFFLHLIEQSALAGLQREGGKFRSFLLRLLNNFLANRWDRDHAQKRGGGAAHVSLNTLEDEARFAAETLINETPETIFERNWAFTVLAQVLGFLEAECVASGKAKLYADLRPYLPGDRQSKHYAEIASRHGLSEGAVKVAVHRLRQRYIQLLRAEIARTVSSPGEVDEEMRHFITVFAR